MMNRLEGEEGKRKGETLEADVGVLGGQLNRKKEKRKTRKSFRERDRPTSKVYKSINYCLKTITCNE